MLKSYKYRIYPNKKQQKVLDTHFGCVRYIYNQGLQKKVETYQQTGKALSCFELTTGLLMNLKHDGKHDWLNEVTAQSLQMALRNLDNAFTKFFREKTGFPKFKTKHNKYQNCQFVQDIKVDFENNSVKFPKIGKIKTIFDRTFEGKTKTTTVSKTPTNKYFVSILVEDGKELPIKPKEIDSKKTIGIDLGIKSFCVISNGEKIDNPKYLSQDIDRLKILQKRASKKKQNGKNKKKINLKIARVHEKISNRRNDFLHKLSSRLISENQTICFEDLNIRGMMKNHNLARSIGDASWSIFVNYCQYKAVWQGKNIIQIGRFDASSKTCHICGYIKNNLTLDIREWKCDNCHTLHDRDLNASKNIKQFGLIRFSKYENYSGPGWSGVPMEMSGS
jgi:putative transposase